MFGKKTELLTLEPVLNQHRLIVDRGVIDWDYASNKDSPAEERLLYMLFYQMSRMCREKRAVKHDDRLCLLYTSPSPRDYAASRMPSSA